MLGKIAKNCEDLFWRLAKKAMPRKLYNFIDTTPNDRLLAGFLVFTGVGTLCVVLASQYWGDIKPCILCTYQRIPYLIAGVMGLVMFWPKIAYAKRRWFLGFAWLALTVNIGTAFYHVGVEQQWWLGTQSCGGARNLPLTIADLATVFAKPKAARCDEILWSLFGKDIVTLATINVFASMSMSVITGLSFIRWPYWNKHNGPAA